MDWNVKQGDEHTPGSIRSYGKKLRERYGAAVAGLDETMLALLQKLDAIPSRRA